MVESEPQGVPILRNRERFHMAYVSFETPNSIAHRLWCPPDGSSVEAQRSYVKPPAQKPEGVKATDVGAGVRRIGEVLTKEQDRRFTLRHRVLPLAETAWRSRGAVLAFRQGHNVNSVEPATVLQG